MSGHTEGPWRITNKRPRRVVREGGKVICTAVLHNGAGGKKDIRKDTSEAEANAHLIAAAPELKEALEDLVFWFDAHDSAVPSINPPTEKLNNALAALAKATGETSS